MADKKLLEESTIRRFMQLANINSEGSGVLSEGKMTPFDKKVSKSNKHSVKVNGRKPGKGMVKESEYEEAMYEEEDMTGGMDAGGMDMGGDLETPDMGGDDMGGDDTGAEGGDTKTKVEDAVESLKNALNDILDAVGSDKQVEDEPGEDAGGEDDMSQDAGGEEDNMGAEDGGTEGEEEPEAIQEKKGKGKLPPFMKKKKEDKKKEDKDEELDESIELIDDSMIEEILARVTARLVREAKASKGYKPHGAGVKQGAPFNKSATHSSKNTSAVNARKGTKSINNRSK